MDPMMLSAGLGSVRPAFLRHYLLLGDNAQAKAEQQASQQALQEAGVNAQIALQSGDRTAATARCRRRPTAAA